MIIIMLMIIKRVIVIILIIILIETGRADARLDSGKKPGAQELLQTEPILEGKLLVFAIGGQ